MVEWRVIQAFQGPFRPRRQGVSSWMTRTELVLETLVHSPLNHVTRLLARKYIIKFIRRISFGLCDTKSYVLLTVHLNIILDNDQLDAHLLYFTIPLL